VDKEGIHTFSGTFIFTKKGFPDKMGCKGDRFALFLLKELELLTF